MTPPLTPDHLAELRRLAEAATDDGWRPNCCYLDAGPSRQFNTAVPPDVVLALIEAAAEAAQREDRLRTIVALAIDRERAEEVWADANTAYNESASPAFTRKFLQLDRLETERAEAVHLLRAALQENP